MDSDPFLHSAGVNLRSLLLENADLLQKAPVTSKLRYVMYKPRYFFLSFEPAGGRSLGTVAMHDSRHLKFGQTYE